ncbi:MAG: hypothetical protein AAF563_03485 [Pseudomonadota bacterium]
MTQIGQTITYRYLTVLYRGRAITLALQLPRAEQLHQSCSAAVDFILEQQDSDGAWRDFSLWVGSSGPWLTGIIGRALLEPDSSVSLTKEHPALVRARDWLHQVERASAGGWGFSEDTWVDADSTASAVLFLAKWSDLDNERLADLLRTFQRDDGGIACFRMADGVPDAWKASHADVTAVAGLAAARLGDRSSAEAAKDYCLQCLEVEGPVASHFWRSSVYTPAMTAYLLFHTNDIRYKHLSRIALSFSSTLETALSLILAVHSGAPIQDCAEKILNAQLSDGSWPASCQMSSPTSLRPWTQANGFGGYRMRFADHKRLFATALSLLALSCALKLTESECSG